MPRNVVLAIAACLTVAGCAIPPTAAERLAESANDLNTAVRFGRMDIAMDNVKESYREDYAKLHRAWGSALRIVDWEVTGLRVRKDGDADVNVTVTWQRFDETTMRNTELYQQWTPYRTTWALVTEEERGGDPGLISDVVGLKLDDATPVSAPIHRQQTRVIYEQ
jgi:hypothetical protein